MIKQFKIQLTMSKQMTLTSVKLPDGLWDEFRISCVKYKFSLQKLTERAMFLYLTNDEFRKQMHNQLDTTLTKEE